MFTKQHIACFFAVLLLSPARLDAAEPVAEFLKGLRARGDFEIALEYIDQQQSRANLPEEVSQELLFQRAVTLHQAAQQLSPGAKRTEQLKQAAEAYETFVQTAPNHPYTAQARSLLGQIQMEQAKEQIWQADRQKRTPKQRAFWLEVRSGLQDVQEHFTRARDLYEANWKQYPVYISDDQTHLRQARDQAQELLIRAQMNLAQCLYWQAQTYETEEPEHRELLTRAGTAYGAIHQRYRSQVGGLYSRLWQGKCFEELGDEQGLRLALGIYGEILEHDGTSAPLVLLKELALRFRLAGLNSDFRRDYQLVEIEAEEWLATAGERRTTAAGLGIEWELCRALEAMSQDPSFAPDTQRDFLERARASANRIRQIPGELTYVASKMVQRIDRQANQLNVRKRSRIKRTPQLAGEKS